jgi:hypothetical protein
MGWLLFLLVGAKKSAESRTFFLTHAKPRKHLPLFWNAAAPKKERKNEKKKNPKKKQRRKK